MPEGQTRTHGYGDRRNPDDNIQSSVHRIRSPELVAGRVPVRDDDRGHPNAEHQLEQRREGIQNLKRRDLLSVEALSDISVPTLAEHIRPAGYFNIKAKRLKNLIVFIQEKYEGDLDELFSRDTETIRTELLSVRGIGLETADSMILYGAGRALFVVDTYTHRILSRHNLIGEEAAYYDLQALFMDNLPHEVELFQEFHALIVKTGKDYCRKKPLCSDCPLEHINREIHG